MRSLVMSVMFFAACAHAQTTFVPYPVTQPSEAANLPHVAVGPNDLLNITIYDSPELSGTVRVSGDGSIKLPMLQSRLKVAGLLPSQIEEQLGQSLEQAQLVVKPVVKVAVAEYQSHTIVVLGAVRKPTTFQAFGDISLLDALTRADGLSDSAGGEILIETKATEDGPGLITRVSTAELMSGERSRKNVVLHGGEEIRVPEQGKIAVIGNVKHPGVYSIREAQDASVLRLIARSEGLAPNASAHAYVYHDASKPHDKEQGRVDVHQILLQKAPDVQLEAGDVLYIPDNRGRRVTLEVMERLLSAGAMTSSAFIYANAH